MQRREHHALLEDAVLRSGGRALWSSGADVAPLYLAVEDAQGARHGLMAYVFFANRKVTRNRPTDEHRLQIRYGDVNSAAWRAQRHPVGVDPTGQDVTLLLGVEPDADLLVALDPLLYDPLPLGISIFWKDADVADAAKGWHVFERDNISGVRRTERRAELGLETIVMLSPERLFDLVKLERQAQALGLDPALRFRRAELIGRRQPAPRRRASGPRRPVPAEVPLAVNATVVRPSDADLDDLERAYELPAAEILRIIAERSRLAMAVRGGVAEHHAGRRLREDPAVRRADVAHQEGPPDFWVTLRNGATVAVEVKNASPRRYVDGSAKVEVQKTRASRGDPLSRLYKADAFDVLAACMYGPSGTWTFRFRRTGLLKPHPDHPSRIAPLQRISDDWRQSLAAALDEDDPG